MVSNCCYYYCDLDHDVSDSLMMMKVMLMMVIMVMMMLMMLMVLIIRLVDWSSPFGIVQSIVFDQVIISRANVIGITI